MAIGRAAEIRRKRFLVALIGFLIGYGIGLFVDSLIDFRREWRVTLAFGLAGMAAALYISERMKKVPTEDELLAAQLEEGLHPLGLTSDNKPE